MVSRVGRPPITFTSLEASSAPHFAKILLVGDAAVPWNGIDRRGRDGAMKWRAQHDSDQSMIQMRSALPN